MYTRCTFLVLFFLSPMYMTSARPRLCDREESRAPLKVILSLRTSAARMHTARWPTMKTFGVSRSRILDEPRLVLQPLAFRELSIVICPTVVISVGDGRTSWDLPLKKKWWHCNCFEKETGLPLLATIGDERAYRLLGTSRRVNICRDKCSVIRTVLFVTATIVQSQRIPSRSICVA